MLMKWTYFTNIFIKAQKCWHTYFGIRVFSLISKITANSTNRFSPKKTRKKSACIKFALRSIKGVYKNVGEINVKFWSNLV